MKTTMKSRRHARNGGFTLIELMIAVAIISILAAVAVPTYQDYTVRAKVSEALNVAASAKVSITEYYITEGKLPTTADEAGIKTVETDYIQAMEYSGDGDSGRLTITLAENIGGTADDQKLEISVVPTSDGALLKWSCAPTTGEEGVDPKYLPANCR